mmetsp:Transcript_49378/g.88200  ORF Transcript_49378/g.88200 Transcript_49378/m.88200 type:complete len:263 (+) Transcript_49378:2766-3554(+)
MGAVLGSQLELAFFSSWFRSNGHDLMTSASNMPRSREPLLITTASSISYSAYEIMATIVLVVMGCESMPHPQCCSVRISGRCGVRSSYAFPSKRWRTEVLATPMVCFAIWHWNRFLGLGLWEKKGIIEDTKLRMATGPVSMCRYRTRSSGRGSPMRSAPVQATCRYTCSSVPICSKAPWTMLRTGRISRPGVVKSRSPGCRSRMPFRCSSSRWVSVVMAGNGMQQISIVAGRGSRPRAAASGAIFMLRSHVPTLLSSTSPSW